MRAKLVRIEEDVFNCCYNLAYIDLKKVIKLGQRAFMSCCSLIEVENHCLTALDKSFHDC